MCGTARLTLAVASRARVSACSVSAQRQQSFPKRAQENTHPTTTTTHGLPLLLHLGTAEAWQCPGKVGKPPSPPHTQIGRTRLAQEDGCACVVCAFVPSQPHLLSLG